MIGRDWRRTPKRDLSISSQSLSIISIINVAKNVENVLFDILSTSFGDSSKDVYTTHPPLLTRKNKRQSQKPSLEYQKNHFEISCKKTFGSAR